MKRAPRFVGVNAFPPARPVPRFVLNGKHEERVGGKRSKLRKSVNVLRQRNVRGNTEGEREEVGDEIVESQIGGT